MLSKPRQTLFAHAPDIDRFHTFPLKKPLFFPGMAPSLLIYDLRSLLCGSGPLPRAIHWKRLAMQLQLFYVIYDPIKT